MTLRSYGPGDAAVTLDLFTEAITQTAAGHYTSEQIEVWAKPGRRDLAVWDAAMTERDAVVATVGDEVVGFSDVDRFGYIDMMFVSPEHHRRGVARALLGWVERRATSSGSVELSADVSITARPFFESSGFVVLAEQRPIREGVAMTNYRMRKVLVPGETLVT